MVLQMRKNMASLLYIRNWRLNYISRLLKIFLGGELKNKAGFVSRKLMYEQAKKYLEIVGLDVSPGTKVSQFSTGQQQMLEIAKAFRLTFHL